MLQLTKDIACPFFNSDKHDSRKNFLKSYTKDFFTLNCSILTLNLTYFLKFSNDYFPRFKELKTTGLPNFRKLYSNNEKKKDLKPSKIYY